MRTGKVLKKEHRAFIKRIVNGEPVEGPTGATIEDYIEPLLFECCYVSETEDEVYVYGKEVIEKAIQYLDYYKKIWEQAKIEYNEIIQDPELRQPIEDYFKGK
jgi:hypothetical protein